MELFVETIKVLTTSLSSTNRIVLGVGRARHRSSVRRGLSGKLFSFTPFRENADTKVEVIVKPIEDDEAIRLGADLIADILLMALMFTYMFYSLYLRHKKFNDLNSRQKEQEQFILARLEYLEAELNKIQR